MPVKGSSRTISRALDAICDTSPIQYLYQIGCLCLLQDLYTRNIIPPGVLIELECGRRVGIRLPGLHDLRRMVVRTPVCVEDISQSGNLGLGEREVLALGLEIPNSVLILDDGLARAYAK